MCRFLQPTGTESIQNANVCRFDTKSIVIRKLFSSQLRINMISGVATAVISTVVVAISYPLYLHFLGYEQYGVWLVLSVVLTFAQLGNLGISQAVMKLVAEEYGRNDLHAAEQYVMSATAILLASGVVVFALIVLLRGQIVALFKLSQENGATALWLLPYVAGLSVYVFTVQAANGMLSGFGRMDLANYAQTGGHLLAVPVAGVMLSCGMGVKSLLISSVVSYLFIHATSLFFVHRVARVRVFRIRNLRVSRMRKLLGFGSAVLGTSFLSMLLSPFNKLMLSRYAGVASIPVYEIAYNGSMQVRRLAEAGIRAMMPEVSRIGANMTEQAGRRIRDINRRCSGLVIWLGVPMYAVLVLGSPWLLRIWLGSRFVVTLPGAFRIALVASFLSLACVPAYYTLMGLGRVRHCFINQAILAAMNLLLILAFAWIDKGLALREVIASMLIGTALSSSYTILQSRRALHHVACHRDMQQLE